MRQSVETVKDVIIELSKALIKAGLARWHKAVKQTGTRIVIHSCGPTLYIDETFTIVEFDCFQLCYLPQGCADWIEFKQEYGRRICILGPLIPAEAVMMSPWQLKAECRKYIEMLGKAGGYILAPGCEFPGNASMLNYKALVDAAKEYGRCGE